ncbi:MAG: preprotein translocase subunit YajC [Chlamydiae bacterium]|nr:preprotein translocase subunit YajC [Chlamydiota bacterium]MBI3277370.1 preprotein translocase subunit YajC [Chlamydiota bacterium]
MNFLFLAMASPQGGQGSPFASMVPFLLIVPIFYFLLIRPQQKRQKQFKQMVAQLKKDDRVVTAGGIHGLVLSVKEHTLTLKIADNVKVEIDRSSIARVLGAETEVGK